MSSTSFPIQIAPVDWNLRLPEYELNITPSGVPLYSINSSIHDICYAELIFENGRLTESKRLSSRLCSHQLLEGSLNFNQSEIVEFFDFHGCTYQVLSDLDFTTIAINSLHKHFEKALSTLIQLITSPIFPEDHLIKGKKSLLSQLHHQLTEPDFVSYREFTAHVFGKESIYGYNTTSELIHSVSREDLMDYHKKNYTSDKLKVFYCGKKLKEEFWNSQLSSFGKQVNNQVDYSIHSHEPIIQNFYIPNCTQMSLKMAQEMAQEMDRDIINRLQSIAQTMATIIK